jgi:hypothetical protein
LVTLPIQRRIALEATTPRGTADACHVLRRRRHGGGRLRRPAEEEEIPPPHAAPDSAARGVRATADSLAPFIRCLVVCSRIGFAWLKGTKCMQDVQGVPAPGREPEDASEPRAGAGAPPDQVLVPEPPHADEGTYSLHNGLPCHHHLFLVFHSIPFLLGTAI